MPSFTSISALRVTRKRHFFLNRLFAKDAGRKVQHQLFGKCKLRFAVFFYNVHPFHLAGNGNDAKALPCRVFFLEQNAKVNLLIAQEWERMAVIHDLRLRMGNSSVWKYFFQKCSSSLDKWSRSTLRQPHSASASSAFA